LQRVIDAEKDCFRGVGLNITNRLADTLNPIGKDLDSEAIAASDFVFDQIKQGNKMLLYDPAASFIPPLVKKKQKNNGDALKKMCITHSELRKMPKESARAQVYVIIDAGVASTSLYLIDMLKKLTHNNVKLIGQPTLADTTYGWVELFPIRRGSLIIPTSVTCGRLRGYNHPYLPDYPLSARRMKDDAWLQEKVLDIINNKRLPVSILAVSSDSQEGLNSSLESCEKAAARGDVNALVKMGQVYHNGLGKPQDCIKALKYYEKAIEMGNVEALSFSANIYLYGKGVGKNVEKGLGLLQAAFDKKDPYAVASFGVFCFDGEFVEKDEQRGIGLLKEAVNLGFLEAQDWLDCRLKLLQQV